MATEIERKFLVRNERWRNAAKGTLYKQGYLSVEKEHTVRVRISDQKSFLTIKGKNQGASRTEFEYEIPLADAEQLIKMCHQPVIEKKRYRIPCKNFIWEVDEFFGENAGLILAEIELESEDQLFEKPDWIGAEVTADPRYYNASLAQNPFSKW